MPQEYQNPLPGVTVVDGVGRIDTVAVLRHCGLPPTEENQRRFVAALRAHAEERGVAYSAHYVSRLGTWVN